MYTSYKYWRTSCLRLIIIVKRQKFQTFKALQVLKVEFFKATKQPSSYRSVLTQTTQAAQCSSLAPARSNTGDTVPSASSPQTCPKYDSLLHQTFAWLYIRKKKSKRKVQFPMNRTDLQIKASYSTKAQAGMKHTTFRRNCRQTLNSILVHTLAGRYFYGKKVANMRG